MKKQIISLQGNSKVIYHFLNGHQLYIYGNEDITKIDIEKNTDDSIKSIEFNEQFKVNLGDSLNIDYNNVTYTIKINKIDPFPTDTNSFILSSEIRNKSTFYITPLIFNDKLDILFTKYSSGKFVGYDNCAFINSYLDKSLKYIYLKYLFIANSNYSQIESTLENNKYFVKRSDSGNYVIYKYKIPEKFLSSVNFFIKGKFSKMSYEAKLRIIGFFKRNSIEYSIDYELAIKNTFELLVTPLAQGLFKTNKLRNKINQRLGMIIPNSIELISKPNYSEEIFN